MNIDFEDKFADHILRRGYEYFLTDKIKDVFIDKDTITAIAVGTDEYNVKIKLKDNVLKKAMCSCPYYEESKYCKHIAGLLYYLNNSTDKKGYSLKGIVNNISEGELREFLYNTLNKNEDLLNKFRVEFINYFPDLKLEEYKRKIYDAIYNCGDRHGFIDYTRSSDYENAMFEYIHEAEKYKDLKNYNVALDIVITILRSIPETEIDDSDGSTSMVADSCIEIICDILDVVDTKESPLLKRILDLVIEEVSTLNLYNYGIDLINVLKYFVDNELYTAVVQESLLSALEKSKGKTYFYNRKEYIEYLIQIYIRTGKSDEITDLLKEFSFDKDVCIKYVDSLLEKNDVKLAIEILKSNLDEKDFSSKTYAQKLSEIYLKYNMLDEYIESLYDLFYKYSRLDFSIYTKIKELYSKNEWPKERDRIIETLKSKDYSDDTLNRIFIEENMIDELYQNVKDKGMNYVKQYEKYLLPKYNKEILDIYARSCVREAQYAKNRSNYRNVAISVNHLILTENSQETAKSLLKYLNETYFCNRPAMKDEFSYVIKNLDEYIK